MLRIGWAGFNALELCGLMRWGQACVAELDLHPLKRAEDADLFAGLILDPRHLRDWEASISAGQRVLVFTRAPETVRARRNVTVVSTSTNRGVLETLMSQWLEDLGRPSVLAAAGPVGATRLPPREIAGLKLLEAGASNEQIASALGIRVSTVKTYLQRLYARLGADNRTHAVALRRAQRDA